MLFGSSKLDDEILRPKKCVVTIHNNCNDRSLDPLPENRIKGYIKSSVRAYYEHLEDRSQGYNYKNETLIELYKITPKEQKQLQTIVSRREKYDRNNKRGRLNRRNEDSLTPRQAKKQETINKVKALHERGLKQVEIANKLSITDRYVRQLLNKDKNRN